MILMGGERPKLLVQSVRLYRTVQNLHMYFICNLAVHASQMHSVHIYSYSTVRTRTGTTVR